MADNNWLLVAALDFGTTYSGYAFSFRNSPNDIQTPQTWYSGSGSTASLKTSTCVLLNPDKTLNSFGYEAEDIYADLASENIHRNYFYFEHFKMKLHHDEQLSRETILEDILGKTVPAIDVFSMSIEYLKTHLMETLKNRLPNVTLSDVRFVLTVPAIWRDSAKEFMREAAEKAGLESKNLVLSLEPEAASIHCKNIPAEKLSGGAGLTIFEAGTQYLIADVGGGTGDFTVHERLSSGKLKEISKASGGAYGGINVNKKFFQFISDIMGARAVKQLKSEEMSDFIDLVRNFEQKNYLIRLPASLMEFATQNNPNFRKNAETMDLKGQVTFLQNKLKIDTALMKSFFAESIQSITTHIEGILQSFPNVKHILLVGGYGECLILQDRVRKCFPKTNLIVPQDSGLAVLKGAVLFGHDLNIISERILRYTYGTDTDARFDPAIHSKDRKYVDDYGVTRCKYSFSVLKKAGESITSDGHKVTRIVAALRKNQSALKYTILYTEKSDIVYINDDCKFLGKVNIPLTGNKDTNRECKISIIFGLTEIRCEVTEMSSGKKVETTFEMLEQQEYK
ncbi:heat shock 70 kDa protein 12B-like [Saccostrea echinata]|uniref:heat shock 70 kDa protein 12B-like n=1 Tax=Saccostrea echinata TaxID=191078 RepID=UPI002A7FF880|nr:heat shock 70 kDa protein 12B-like [Saccostrea echinata]